MKFLALVYAAVHSRMSSQDPLREFTVEVMPEAGWVVWRGGGGGRGGEGGGQEGGEVRN